MHLHGWLSDFCYFPYLFKLKPPTKLQVDKVYSVRSVASSPIFCWVQFINSTNMAVLDTAWKLNASRVLRKVGMGVYSKWIRYPQAVRGSKFVNDNMFLYTT